MTRRIRLQATAAGAALALSAVVASPAAAGVISDRPCYREFATARFAGNGFQPGQPVAITLDSQQIATQSANAAGAVAGQVSSLEPIPRSEVTRSLTMSQVNNPAIAARVVFQVTKLYVVTKPRLFRPGRRLRMRAGGFYGAGRTLYAHVRGPRKRNLRIGKLRGPCGKVSATKKVILKRGDPVGLYPTQFDTSRKYRGRASLPFFRKIYGITPIFRFSRTSALSRPPLARETWVPAPRD